MPTEIIELQLRLSSKINDTNLQDFVTELNISKNKGIVLKKYKLLEKGERWRNKDLINFLEKKGYSVKTNEYFKYYFRKIKKEEKNITLINDENKFKIGDTVKVLNPGYCYTTYDIMFKKLKFKNTEKNHINYNTVKTTQWEIFNIDEYKNEVDRTLLALQNINDEKEQLLIDEKGVIKIPKSLSLYRQTNLEYDKVEFGEVLKPIKIVYHENEYYIVFKDFNNIIPLIDFNNYFILEKEDKIKIDYSYLSDYENIIPFKTRRELINKFNELLPTTTNKHLSIEYYKLPNYKQLFKRTIPFKNATEYEFAHRYGEYRIMRGYFVLDGLSFKTRDGYLLMADLEDNGIEKPIIVRNLISFTFNNIKYIFNK